MTSPTFSIVIPTRNRAGLLRHALATARSQPASLDLEIIVSDNASSDDTAAVAQGSGDPRVRYVRSDRPLSNAASWEFAVSHATGEWVTVLGDDDGFVPSLLTRMDALTAEGHPMMVWQPAWYVHPDTDPPWPVAEERNLLTVHAFSGHTREIGAQQQLERFFARGETDPIPGLVNAFVRRDLLDELSRRAGRVFGEPDPNWAAGAGLLACCDAYLVVDLPLTVAGVSPVNIGGGFLRNTRGHEVIREFDHERLFTEVPTQARTCANLIAETLLRQRRALPSELGRFELDPVRYFVTTGEELSDRRRAPDGGSALGEWRAALREQSPPVAAAVKRQLRARRVRAAARRLGTAVPGASQARRMLRRRRGQAPFRLFAGAEHGFSDLPGAARTLDALLPVAPVRNEAARTRA